MQHIVQLKNIYICDKVQKYEADLYIITIQIKKQTTNTAKPRSHPLTPSLKFTNILVFRAYSFHSCFKKKSGYIPFYALQKKSQFGLLLNYIEREFQRMYCLCLAPFALIVTCIYLVVYFHYFTVCCFLRIPQIIYPFCDR